MVGILFLRYSFVFERPLCLGSQFWTPVVLLDRTLAYRGTCIAAKAFSLGVWHVCSISEPCNSISALNSSYYFYTDWKLRAARLRWSASSQGQRSVLHWLSRSSGSLGYRVQSQVVQPLSLAIWLWANHLIFLRFGFVICKMRVLKPIFCIVRLNKIKRRYFCKL